MRKMKLFRVALTLFTFSMCASIGSSIFLRAHNNSLATQIKQTEDEIAAIELEIETYSVAVQDLTSKDRVYEVAEMEGMAYNQSSVITVKDGE